MRGFRPRRQELKSGGKMPSIDQFIVWLVVGLLGGSLAGLAITWERGGFGHLRNLGLGLSGAVVGGLIFRLFGFFPRLDRIAISLRDIVAAFLGSLILLAALWLWQRFKRSA
jgi:uncharacterized membrane protein YeaQ/YmgE (transglycosylase-associated protein family)